MFATAYRHFTSQRADCQTHCISWLKSVPVYTTSQRADCQTHCLSWLKSVPVYTMGRTLGVESRLHKSSSPAAGAYDKEAVVSPVCLFRINHTILPQNGSALGDCGQTTRINIVQLETSAIARFTCRRKVI